MISALGRDCREILKTGLAWVRVTVIGPGIRFPASPGLRAANYWKNWKREEARTPGGAESTRKRR
jgi:hypothetical protein